MDKTKRKAVKGTAYYYDDDSMEFVRQGKGREVQKDVRKHRGSKMYRTVGEKQSQHRPMGADGRGLREAGTAGASAIEP